MGVGDWLKDKITPQFVKDVNKALVPKEPKAPPAETYVTPPPTPAPEAGPGAINVSPPVTKEKLP